MLVFCGLCNSSFGQAEGDSDHGFVQSLQAAFNASGVAWDEVVAYPELEAYGMEFACPLEASRDAATSVHELTAYDIKVVAALGDSVTAGFGAGASTVFRAFTEYRGVSWSIGGDGDLASLTTLPNIIRKYNPNVKGFSIKTGRETSSNANLNAAITGAIAKDMPGQARNLVEKMKADSSIDFENDWKLVTIWIGGNDLCAICNGSPDHSPESYVGYIRETIEYLRAEMPRTFVNVVKMLDVTQITALGGVVCNIVHLYACGCAKNAKEVTREAFETYNSLLEEMEQSFQDNYSDDFAVVLQPFMQGVKLPQNDVSSYFAPDCFHFSIKSHEIAATALWNNMNEPLGMKDDDLDLENGKQFNCPHEDFPFFFTHKNSQQALGMESNGTVPSKSSHSVQILAILLGTGAGLYITAMVVLVTIVGVVWECKKRRRSRHYLAEDSETIVLVRS